jgi:hypothetical protein
VKPDQEPRLSPRMQRAVNELADLIRAQYPEAAFQVRRSPEDARTIHLLPIVDVEDRDEILDIVVDRMMEFQIREKLALFVIPLRTPTCEAQTRAVLQREPHRAPIMPVDAGTSR